MNKRIYDLWHEAVLDTYVDDTKNIHVRFAELIIKECMRLNRDILCEDNPDYLDDVYKEYFGM